MTAGVIDAQAMENGGVHIVYVHRIADDVVAKIVGLAVNDARLDSTAGHPNRKAPRMVVTTVVLASQVPLAVNRSTKLATPDNKRVVQQPAVLEILNQCPTGLVDVTALIGKIAADVEMLVPTAMKDLDESHVSFGHSPGQQTARGKRAGLL